MMNYFQPNNNAIIHFWKLIFLVKFLQCEINTTVHKLFPLVIFPSHNLPLTEQVMYDLKNTIRKTIEINDFHDDDDYKEDEEIEINKPLTTSDVISNAQPISSSSTRFIPNFIYIILLVLIQTNK